MINIKQVLNKEIKEFIYDTEEERELHIKLMISQGWKTSGKTCRLNPEVNIMQATDDDYQLYADFWKYH